MKREPVYRIKIFLALGPAGYGFRVLQKRRFLGLTYWQEKPEVFFNEHEALEYIEQGCPPRALPAGVVWQSDVNK